eukprot:CAMPEP_0182422102 /NCGR_PEP_ID=MMETSP1167-20130531/7692_1 /TAXON_ID=2988 /ORGANISM="Mallomonas Sp, Strain CCMP3275" /LENGTH=518 /DNA_ID=CAMNT_0024599853 /DNA_START=387 /DNA_END=1943 /DNA_ORIENTATION=-
MKSWELYKVKPFTGFAISTSQVSLEDRTRIASLVEENGGTFLVSMSKAASTHLVTTNTNNTKYDYAKLWGGVRVVSPDWITECVHQKAWLPERNFPVPSYEKITPIETERERNMQSELLQESERGEKEEIQRKREKEDKGGDEEMCSAVDNNKGMVTTTERERERGESEKDRNECEERNDLSAPSYVVGKDREREREYREKQSEGGMKSVTEKTGVVHSYVLEESKYKDVLRGEVFFMAGFEPELRDRLLLLLLSGGGTRHMMMTDSITKILLGPMTEPRMWQVARALPRAQIIKPEWLERVTGRSSQPSLTQTRDDEEINEDREKEQWRTTRIKQGDERGEREGEKEKEKERGDGMMSDRSQMDESKDNNEKIGEEREEEEEREKEKETREEKEIEREREGETEKLAQKTQNKRPRDWLSRSRFPRTRSRVIGSSAEGSGAAMQEQALRALQRPSRAQVEGTGGRMGPGEENRSKRGLSSRISAVESQFVTFDSLPSLSQESESSNGSNRRSKRNKS